MVGLFVLFCFVCCCFFLGGGGGGVLKTVLLPLYKVRFDHLATLRLAEFIGVIPLKGGVWIQWNGNSGIVKWWNGFFLIHLVCLFVY